MVTITPISDYSFAVRGPDRSRLNEIRFCLDRLGLQTGHGLCHDKEMNATSKHQYDRVEGWWAFWVDKHRDA